MSASVEQSISREAGAWVYRLKDDDSAACRAEFEAWMKTSPQHVAEFLLASATDVELGRLEIADGIDVDALLAEADSNVMPLQAAPAAVAGAVQPRRAKRPFWPFAVAAGIAAVATLVTLIAYPRTYGTDVGEQRSVKLDDGSMVQLNTRSRIEVRYTNEARVIRLIDGEALFTVAADSKRPFAVESGNARVHAIGTQFNVYRRHNGAKVSVVEGRVSITTSSPSIPESSTQLLLDAGQEAAVENSGRIVKSASPQLTHALAWRQRHLEFHSATVGEVAAEFNRYNREQIEIADEALARRSMSGLFDADEPQSLVDFLTNEGGVRVERRGNAIVLSAP